MVSSFALWPVLSPLRLFSRFCFFVFCFLRFFVLSRCLFSVYKYDFFYFVPHTPGLKRTFYPLQISNQMTTTHTPRACIIIIIRKYFIGIVFVVVRDVYVPNARCSSICNCGEFTTIGISRQPNENWSKNRKKKKNNNNLMPHKIVQQPKYRKYREDGKKTRRANVIQFFFRSCRWSDFTSCWFMFSLRIRPE